MTRRPRAQANREGRVWQRADGRWCARVYPPEPGSKPRYVYGRTAAGVREKRKALERDLAAGLPSKDQTVGQYLDLWLATTLTQETQGGHLAVATFDSYRENTRLHIVPDLGPIPLRALTVSRVRQWLADLSVKPSGRPRRTLRKGERKLPPAEPLSPRTVTYCHAILRRALNDARRDELVARNVAELVKPPKQAKKERAALTKDQTAALLDASSRDRLWCYWLVVLTLGLRRGEGLGLRWSDIDWDARTISLSVTIQRVRGDADPATGLRKGTLVAKAMKTDASTATVPVGQGVLDAIRIHQREQRADRMRAVAWLDADLIFTSNVGTALEPRGINRAWQKVCAAAGVDGARIHDLRHACGTYLADAGLHPKAIQTTLRHARMATTEIYVHALAEMNRTAAETMDSIVTELRRRPAELRRRPTAGGGAKS